jgi:biotin operon repressor
VVKRLPAPTTVAELLDRCRAIGLTVERARNGHYTVRTAAGRRVAAVGCTPGDRRSILNDVTALRHAGFDVRQVAS